MRWQSPSSDDRTKRDDGTRVESCAIITMAASKLMSEIHNAEQRMPAILAHPPARLLARGPATFSVSERGNAVAVLGHDPTRDEVVLGNEFRPGVLVAGDYPYRDNLIAGQHRRQ